MRKLHRLATVGAVIVVLLFASVALYGAISHEGCVDECGRILNQDLIACSQTGLAGVPCALAATVKWAICMFDCDSQFLPP